MKRIIALFMAAMMVIMMMPAAKAQAASENVTMTVTADKSVAMRGDTVNFSVAIGAVESLGGMCFKLVIPAGMTIVDSSITIPEGVKETLKSDGDINIPASTNGYVWDYATGSVGYKGTSNVTVLTFSCTVNADSAYEAKNVSITLDEGGCCFDATDDMYEHNVTVVPASVTVSKAPVYVSGVSLDKVNATLKDGASITLVATVTPDDADNKAVTWKSSNTSVATVVDGKVTAVKEGTATITVTTQDGSKTATCAVTVTCNHNMTKTAAKAETCGEAGNIEYYTCSKCSKIFSDAEGTTVVTKTEIPATGNHTEEVRNAVAATEEAPGYTGDTYCSVCDTKLKSGTEIPALPHTHVMTKHDKVDAKCEDDGTIEYYECTKCHKTYADAEGTTEVTDLVIPQTGHTVTGGWVTDANNHWKVCDNCPQKADEAAHTFEWVLDKAATEDETGLKHEECLCGYKRSEDTVIDKLTHTHVGVYHAAVEPTCKTPGSVEYYSCENDECDGKYYSDEACQLALADVVLAIVPENHVYDDDKDAECNECQYVRYYEITSGADSAFTKNSSATITIKADGDFALFTGVKVNGTLVDPANYTVEAGSTVLTFKSAYLSTLAAGKYSVEFVYSDGKTAVTTMTISNPPAANNNAGNAAANNSAVSPKTGESVVNVFVYMMVMGAAVVGLLVWRKKATNETTA